MEGVNSPVMEKTEAEVLKEMQKAHVDFEKSVCTEAVLRKLMKNNQATADMEYFLQQQANLLKCNQNVQNFKHRSIAKICMKIKVDDQAEVSRMKKARKDDSRALLKETVGGGKRFEKLVLDVKKKSKEVREKLEAKNETKVCHLRKKHCIDEIMSNVKNGLKVGSIVRHKHKEKFTNLSIYKNDSDPKTEKTSVKPPIIVGKVKILNEEREVMDMNPKLPTQTDLDRQEFIVEMETAFTKVRFSLRNKKEFDLLTTTGTDKVWDDMSEEEKQDAIYKEQLMRRVFTREHQCINMSNFRPTDSKHNAHIVLPKALSTLKEVYINLRREKYMATLARYLKRLEGKKIQMNMTNKQHKGYLKLQKRLKKNEFKLCETDKTNNFVAIDNDDYLKMGEEHTSKDKEVTLDTALNFQKELDKDTSMMIKIFNVGGSEKERSRHRETSLNQQGIVPVELLIKDHKKPDENCLLKTRPVANGSASSSSGASEIWSVIMDGIIETKPGKKSVTSSEEMLRMIMRINDMVLRKGWKIYDEAKDREVRKMMEENPDSDPPVILIATDGVALYPSLNRYETARHVRQFVEKSNATFKNVDIKEALAYLAINKDILVK